MRRRKTTLLDELRSALASFRAARPRLVRAAPGSCAVVRAGRVEVVTARRAAKLRASGATADPTLVVEIDGPPRIRRMTFLADSH